MLQYSLDITHPMVAKEFNDQLDLKEKELDSIRSSLKEMEQKANAGTGNVVFQVNAFLLMLENP